MMIIHTDFTTNIVISNIIYVLDLSKKNGKFGYEVYFGLIHASGGKWTEVTQAS